MKYRAKVIKYSNGDVETIFQYKIARFIPWMDCKIETGTFYSSSNKFIINYDECAKFVISYEASIEVIESILRWMGQEKCCMLKEGYNLYFGFNIGVYRYSAYQSYAKAQEAYNQMKCWEPSKEIKEIKKVTTYKLDKNKNIK